MESSSQIIFPFILLTGKESLWKEVNERPVDDMKLDFNLLEELFTKNQIVSSTSQFSVQNEKGFDADSSKVTVKKLNSVTETQVILKYCNF